MVCSVAVFKKPSDAESGSDPLFRYLERTPAQRDKLERLELLLERLNAKTAEMLRGIQSPDGRKNS